MEEVVSPTALPSPDFWRGKSVFMTGHTGFKGSWLVMLLGSLGAKVHGFALAPETDPSMFNAFDLAGGCASHRIADVRDAAALADAVLVAAPDIAIHMAAQPIVSVGYDDPLGTFDTNVMGTANFLEACRAAKVPLTFVVSSDKCYRNDESGLPFPEDAPLGGKDPYSASKAGTEIVVQSWQASFMHEESGLRLASGRAGNVIGGGDWALNRLLPDAARAFSAGADLEVRSPRSTRPWQHVLEPISAYLLVIERMAVDVAYAASWNFGPIPAVAIPVEQVLEHAVAAWGDGARWVSTEPPSFKEAKSLLLSSDRAQNELGWHPRLGLAETVQWTMDWYRTFYRDGIEAARELTCEQIDQYLS